MIRKRIWGLVLIAFVTLFFTGCETVYMTERRLGLDPRRVAPDVYRHRNEWYETKFGNRVLTLSKSMNFIKQKESSVLTQDVYTPNSDHEFILLVSIIRNSGLRLNQHIPKKVELNGLTVERDKILSTPNRITIVGRGYEGNNKSYRFIRVEDLQGAIYTQLFFQFPIDNEDEVEHVLKHMNKFATIHSHQGI